MIEMSATVTAGNGSEKHNHDLDYRETLEHVHKRENGIIELVPYEKSYKDQINELMKPYIEKYNAGVETRYLSAWERYNSGKIKTKPRKRDYKQLSYDYYSDHVDDTRKNPVTGKEEKIPIFRSLIIGIGDKNDRHNITEQQAEKIFRNMLKQFQEDFPDFKILGCTMHLDEEGFYHCHLDFKPLYKRSEASKGLEVGVGLETALEAMGYVPEQSIINGKDKVPLLFNAMRNKIYYNLEKQMAATGIRMQYGVSRTKEPAKDSSRNQSLKDWQTIQDKVRELQHDKNMILDIVSKDEVSPEGYEQLVEASENIANTLESIENEPRSRINKNRVVVDYNLLDQLGSFTKELMKVVANLFQKVRLLKQENNNLQAELEHLRPLEHCGTPEYRIHIADLERKAKRTETLERENKILKSLIEKDVQEKGPER